MKNNWEKKFDKLWQEEMEQIRKKYPVNFSYLYKMTKKIISNLLAQQKELAEEFIATEKLAIDWKLVKQRKQLLKQVLEKRPFIDLTKDWNERKRIEKFLDEWEQKIKKL